MVYNKNPCIEVSFVCPTSIQALGVDFKHHTGPSSRLGTLYCSHRQWYLTKTHVFRLVLLVRRRFKRWGSISNTTLDPSGHGMKTPSSRLGTLFRRHRQWFITKKHVFRLVLLVRPQFKRCCLFYNTTLGPSGHGMKTPSSRLGTLYRRHRQWFLTKTHVFRLVLFVRRRCKRWGSISNTTLGPCGHGMKPSSSRLRTLYSCQGPWFITKSMYLVWFCFSGVDSSIWGRFQTPHWAPVAMVRSHHRRGWGPCTAPIGNGL